VGAAVPRPPSRIPAVSRFNAVDAVLVVALLVAAVRGYRQGAVAQVAAFAGTAMGLMAGAAAAPPLATRLVPEPGTTLALLTLGLLLAAVVLGQALGLAAGRRLQSAAAGAGRRTVVLDQAGGIGVGLVATALIAWLLGSALLQGPVPWVAQQVRDSTLATAIATALPPAPDLIGRVGNYLQQHGFPQVFTDLREGTTSPPVAPPDDAVVAVAQAAARASTVQVQALGCGGVSSGSGFVTQPGYVVTNAHVVAGGEELTVRDESGAYEAVPVLVDPQTDLAVLAAPGVTAPPIAFVSTPAERATAGATLGFPGGQPALVVKPASVAARTDAVGRDIYGQGFVSREVLTLSAPPGATSVQQGDSGGPFVTGEGLVGGVVFAAAAAEPGTGYALSAEAVAPRVSDAIGANTPVVTGPCRF